MKRKKLKNNEIREHTAANERFGIMAGVPRWIGGEKQQVTWLVASAGSPPLCQAATTLGVSGGQRNRNRLKVNTNNRSERAEQKKISLKSVAKSPKTYLNRASVFIDWMH